MKFWSIAWFLYFLLALSSFLQSTRSFLTGDEMEELTKEETITMLYGMLYATDLSWTEKEIIKAAIRYLEEGE